MPDVNGVPDLRQIGAMLVVWHWMIEIIARIHGGGAGGGAGGCSSWRVAFLVITWDFCPSIFTLTPERIYRVDAVGDAAACIFFTVRAVIRVGRNTYLNCFPCKN